MIMKEKMMNVKSSEAVDMINCASDCVKTDYEIVTSTSDLDLEALQNYLQQTGGDESE